MNDQQKEAPSEEGKELKDEDYLVDRSYRDPGGNFRFVLIPGSLLSVVRFRGKGSVEGSRQFVSMLDESMDALPKGERVTSLVDCSELKGTPLRAQFIIGKWLFGNKQHIKQVAVFGARAWERQIAKAIFKIGGMKAVAFFKWEDEATDWLKQPRGCAPTLPAK